MAANPAKVIAVDLNPNHIALTRLKLAALNYLPTYEDFFSFFGYANSKENRVAYDTFLVEQLDPTTRKYWESWIPLRGRRINMFARNLYRYGLLGRFLSVLNAVARLHGKKLNEMLTAKTPAEQRAIFERTISPLFDSRFVKALSKMPVSFYALGIPPAQFEELNKASGGDPAGLIRRRIEKLACDFPMQENYFAWQAFGDGYAPEGNGPLPPYLQEQNYPSLRRNVSRLSVQQVNLGNFLAAEPAGSVDRVVLLDAQDWMSDAQLNILWRAIDQATAPGARVIFRTAGTETILPGRVDDSLLSKWNYLAQESAEGHARDRSSIYGGFHVYERRA